jgi:hypothetical protein
MPNYTLTVDLTLQGPILTHSTAIGASGISSPFAINADRHHYLPGTLIKGKLRQAWEELHVAVGVAFAPNTQQLLGDQSGDSQNDMTSVDPIRGLIHFEDFVDCSSRTVDIRYRICMDEERGSVSKGAYQVIEAPYAAGERVTFTGRIRYRAPDQRAASGIKRYVETGLKWIPSIGAERTTGFGRLIDVSVSNPIASNPYALARTVTGDKKLELGILPQSPFCLARRRVSHNLFESDTVIPGSALKGSLASSWRTLLGLPPNGAVIPAMDGSRLELCRNFEKIRITHAFPAQLNQSARPVTAPLSLVKANGQLHDIALFSGPILIGIPPMAPEFSIDWKRDGDVRELFGWGNPERELRVRTAIDPLRRKAKDEQLFAYEMVVPKGMGWHCQLDLDEVPEEDRAKVEAQVCDLLNQGLHWLGKTKSYVKVDILAKGLVSPKHLSQTAPRDDVWILTLQTPALLCDPTRLMQTSLLSTYDEVWSQFSAGALRLKHFYASQSLAGGFYLYRRFQPQRGYTPWLLTDAGSVFVLEAASGQQIQAQACIDKWMAHGLPLPEWAEMRYGNHWASCPFLHEGGYGEIAVNLDIHWSLRPGEGEYYAI